MNIGLEMPGSACMLYPGNRIKLGRFETTEWVVNYGWYSFGGNRPVCGWYLTADNHELKPLQLPDLDDIYFIE